MPFINIKTSVIFSEEQCTRLKGKLGEIITYIEGKTEQRLMICIEDNQKMYFQGQNNEAICYLDIKLYKEAKYEDKERLTVALFGILCEEFNMNAQNIFISYSEFFNWGTDGIFK